MHVFIVELYDNLMSLTVYCFRISCAHLSSRQPCLQKHAVWNIKLNQEVVYSFSLVTLQADQHMNSHVNNWLKVN